MPGLWLLYIQNLQMLLLRMVLFQSHIPSDGKYHCCQLLLEHTHQRLLAILPLTVHIHPLLLHLLRHLHCFLVLEELDVRHSICVRNHKNVHRHG